mgnify:FL=1
MEGVKLLNEKMETIAMVNSDSFKGNYQNLQIEFCCCNIDVGKIKFVVCNLLEEDIYRVELLHKFYVNGESCCQLSIVNTSRINTLNCG